MSIYDSWIGRHVVVRTYSAGVHVGTLAAVEGHAVVLTNARRIWKWGGAFTLSELATQGLNPELSRMSVAVAEILLSEMIELIPTSDKARRTFDATHE